MDMDPLKKTRVLKFMVDINSTESLNIEIGTEGGTRSLNIYVKFFYVEAESR